MSSFGIRPRILDNSRRSVNTQQFDRSSLFLVAVAAKDAVSNEQQTRLERSLSEIHLEFSPKKISHRCVIGVEEAVT